MATSNEKLRDESLAHAIWVSRYSTGVANRMIKILNEGDAELTARLLVAMDTLDADSFTVTRLESLLASVRETNREAVQTMYAGLSTELQGLAQHEAGFQLRLFQFAIPDDVLALHPLVCISPDAVYAAAMARPFQGRLLSEWADNLEADRMTRISNTVRQGFLLGDTHEQIARKVRGHANLGYQDGALQMSRTNAGSIAKTAVGHLAATARNSFADANDDILKGKQWLSTLDNRTSKDCRVRDCLKYTLDNKPIGHKVPYLQGPGKIHFCCRSVETYILKSSNELGIQIGEVQNSSRASMDGQVPGDTTYSDWLQRQPFSRQKEILGETRARMMRDGVMKYDDFYSDKGEWLTLAQLNKLSELRQAGKSPGFSLDDAQSVAEIEQGMRGIIADEMRFPEETTLESARIAAGAMQNVIERFRLPPVKYFGEVSGTRKSAAGAYFEENAAVHVSRWAMQSTEWDAICENSATYDFVSSLSLERMLTVSDAALLAAGNNQLNYAAISSVAGTVTHEMGHHLYYQHIDDLSQLTTKAYNEGWWRPVSYYASENERELFAEILTIFMLGSKDDYQRINPELLEWLKKNSRV